MWVSRKRWDAVKKLLEDYERRLRELESDKQGRMLWKPNYHSWEHLYVPQPRQPEASVEEMFELLLAHLKLNLKQESSRPAKLVLTNAAKSTQ